MSSSSSSNLSFKLQKSSVGSHLSNFQKNSEDVSELLKESPVRDPNT